MGADLCLNYLWIEKGKKANWNAGKRRIKQLVKVWMKSGHLPECVGQLDPEDENCAENLEAHFTDALLEVRVATEKGGRDVCDFELVNYNLFITGGTSWGDDPSEMYRCLNDLNSSDESILEACGFYPKVIDWKKVITKILKNKSIQPLLIGIDTNLDELLHTSLKGK